MRFLTLPGGRHVPRWGLALGAIALVASVTATAVLTRTAVEACAAVVAARSGSASFYTGDSGNCSLDPPADRLYVALGPAEYASAAACGSYLDVTGPKGTVRVKVTDQCPSCEPGHLDLSRDAFARIAALGDGVARVSYQPVRNPELPAPLSVRLKNGVSRYWFAALVDNHGNPLSTVEVQVGGGWTKLARQDYNYWQLDSGAGAGPFTLRVTDAEGQQAVVTGISLRTDRAQPTAVALYPAAGAAPAGAASIPPVASPSPSALPPLPPQSQSPSMSQSTSPGPGAPSLGRPTVPAAVHPCR